MRKLSKYLATLSLSLQTSLAYPLNFMLGRMRQVIVLILLYFLWTSVSAKTGSFAGYSRDALITYLVIAELLSALVFTQSKRFQFEINNGIFSTQLIKPISHLWFTYSREMADRIVMILFAIIEVGIFMLLFRVRMALPSLRLAGAFALLGVIAHFLYFLMAYCMGMIAFWSREAAGPSFLLEWIISFCAGSFFPLAILSVPFQTALAFTPFPSLLFVPVQVFLGQFSDVMIFQSIALAVVWTAGLYAVTRLLWNRGLRVYSGEGI